MKKRGKNSLSIRPANKGDKLNNLGVIRFGESRPAPEMVDIDVDLDTKAEKELSRLGLEMIKKDKIALINYAITKALEGIVKDFKG
jgi:hypothetical protein